MINKNEIMEFTQQNKMKKSYLPWTITDNPDPDEPPIALTTEHWYTALSLKMTGVKIKLVDPLTVCTESLSLLESFTTEKSPNHVTLGSGTPSNMQERVRLLPFWGIGEGTANGPLRMSAGSARRMW